MSPWFVKYDGVCSRCGNPLFRGMEAVWDRSSKTIRCVACPTSGEAAPKPAPVPQPTFDPGVAGASARREHERLAAKRAERIDGKVGPRLGRIVRAIVAEPQSTRAWAIGAVGEEKLGKALEGFDGFRVLHDRRVPGSRANVDHIVIAPAGIFVVDAKHLEGSIEIRNRGGFFRPDWRLTVGRRDQSKLARAMPRQVEVVRTALMASGVDPLPPITPVLCFVDGDWPLIRPPKEFEGVLLESERSIRKVVTGSHVLGGAEIDRLAEILGRALPPA